MQNAITLRPIINVNGDVNIPGSKSISNRVLLLAAQARGITKLYNLLNSEDVHYMLVALKKLGIKYILSEDKTICEIHGIGSPLQPKNNMSLFLGNAGTAVRPLTAALCLQDKKIILDGNCRMQERPIKDLVDALCQGGAKIEYLVNKNYTPIAIKGGYIGGIININSKLSSQFLTAILMMAPMAKNDSIIYIKDVLVSRPYIDITLNLMKTFGINIINKNYNVFYIKGGQTYSSPVEYFIESDASSASYFLAAAAIKGGKVRVNGIGKNSIQGDIYFADIFKKMGAKINYGNNYIECVNGNILHPIDMDMNNIPDSAMTVAILALFTSVGSKNVLRNIYNWRVKETDRLSAMATELRKIGATITEGKDNLEIIPPKKFISAKIHTYDDHRIAMCFSLIALSGIEITILNPECTKKTFPGFFNTFMSISTFKD